jgi:L-lactate dehydrogenase complex protein LldG
MSARERILQRVTAASAPDSQAVDAILNGRARGPAPSLPTDLVARFVECATRLASDVRQVKRADVPAVVARYLEENGAPRRAVCWPDIAKLPWPAQRIETEVRAARGEDLVGITGAFAAIAETGTLMLCSGAATPATVSLLPETHIAIVDTACIVATMEDAWARLRQEHGAVPRAVNFISGPSRTADVEQTVTLGAHGPRRVLIVLVSD